AVLVWPGLQGATSGPCTNAGITLKTGVAATTALAPASMPPALSATKETTSSPPSPRHVHVGGFRRSPTHVILWSEPAASTQRPALLPVTRTILIPAGGRQSTALTKPMLETFERVTR